MRVFVTLLSLGALGAGFVVGAVAQAGAPGLVGADAVPAQVPSFNPPLPSPMPTPSPSPTPSPTYPSPSPAPSPSPTPTPSPTPPPPPPPPTPIPTPDAGRR